MRIALLQSEAVPLDVAGNLKTIRAGAERARQQGAEMLLTPELFVSGYAPRELAEWLTRERISGIPAALADLAADTGIAIAASFPWARSDGSYAIAAGFWDASGTELLHYEKVHLWGADERLAFTPAVAAPATVSWQGRRIAFQICYDIEFPEPSRFLAEQGVDLLLVPTAIDGDSAYVPDVLVRARAAENGMVVAYADHALAAGTAETAAAAEFTHAADPTDAAGSTSAAAGFAGLSTVAGLEGVVLARAGATTELLIAELPDPTLRPAAGADYLSDRLPAVYADWR